jgi:hypothetical protein
MSKDYFDPKTSANPSGNQTQVGRSNEALRLAYLLLWNFAYRVADGNPEKLEAKFYSDLVIFMTSKVARDETPEPTYHGLMLEVQNELNYFINGAHFDETHTLGRYELGIRDTEYLDEIAEVFQDLDGIVGYILAGNFYTSEKLLTQLCESEFHLVSRLSSTRERALETLKNQKLEQN